MLNTAELPVINSADRLSLAVFFAIVVHVIFVLGIDFSPTDDSSSHVNTLDIILVQTHTDKAPDEASYLAQANQKGGGDSSEKARPTAPLPAPFVSRIPAEITTSLPLSASRFLENKPQSKTAQESQPAESVSKPILAQTVVPSKQKVKKQPPPRPKSVEPRPVQPVAAKNAPPVPTENVSAASLITRSLAMASLNAEIQQRLRAYAERPRRKWITARTREYKYASYMEAWRTKVEQVGNLNYPGEAMRRKLSGNLLLGVAINADGSINEITLHRSSGFKILDDAAIRIVKLASPYAPLPASIRKDVDILHIERTWQFLAANRLSAR
uniref:Protein TonB n=1 Tax=Candidatus Kentrum sp. TUN TaxID=2126343 RepID=A0A450ZHL9_9GAMM|nr:MAG: protein TonB [Candidatus Kentron sp. TUN]VFK53274.1 MAG: protein TonB [Candidatus Kentron sp. TUN]VFK60464.1 MAG: protein TonB [Candidatus Kentron sp. TUN]